MVLRVRPTPTRFPTNSLYTPMDNTPLHSISSVCYPWGDRCYRYSKLTRHNQATSSLVQPVVFFTCSRGKGSDVFFSFSFLSIEFTHICSHPRLACACSFFSQSPTKKIRTHTRTHTVFTFHTPRVREACFTRVRAGAKVLSARRENRLAPMQACSFATMGWYVWSMDAENVVKRLM